MSEQERGCWTGRQEEQGRWQRLPQDRAAQLEEDTGKRTGTSSTGVGDVADAGAGDVGNVDGVDVGDFGCQ